MEFKTSDFKDFFKYDPSSAVNKEESQAKKNEYYAKVSYRYGYAKKILCVILLLIIVIFLFMGSITYDNFYYLVKDFGVAVDFVNSGHESITYGVGESQSFAMYRGGLAVASREGISIYSAGGRELFSISHQYGNPILKSSAKYALLYDNGGKQYSLYNSFSKVSEETLDCPIRDAEIADTGEYAIVTSAEGYMSVLRVYDKNGKRYDYGFSSAYISSLAMSRDGTKVAVSLLHAEGEKYRSEIRVYRVGSSSYQSSDMGFSRTPYKIGFFDNGSICAVGSEGINVFNKNLELESKYYTESEVYAYSLSENHITIAFFDEKTSRSQIIMFDKKGNVSYNDIIAEKILDIKAYNEYLFLQNPNGFVRINTAKDNDRSEIKVVSTDFKMLLCGSDTVLICNSSYARFIKF